MRSTFKKALALLMMLAMVFSFAACGSSGYTSGNTEYVIGFSGPLTGGAAVYGVAVNNSAQMAVDEINEAGGLNGVKFKLIATDDTHDATKVAANYASMLEGVVINIMREGLTCDVEDLIANAIRMLEGTARMALENSCRR